MTRAWGVARNSCCRPPPSPAARRRACCAAPRWQPLPACSPATGTPGGGAQQSALRVPASCFGQGLATLAAAPWLAGVGGPPLAPYYGERSARTGLGWLAPSRDKAGCGCATSLTPVPGSLYQGGQYQACNLCSERHAPPAGHPAKQDTPQQDRAPSRTLPGGQSPKQAGRLPVRGRSSVGRQVPPARPAAHPAGPLTAAAGCWTRRCPPAWRVQHTKQAPRTSWTPCSPPRRWPLRQGMAKGNAIAANRLVQGWAPGQKGGPRRRAARAARTAAAPGRQAHSHARAAHALQAAAAGAHPF